MFFIILVRQYPGKYLESSVECFGEINLSWVPWMIRHGQVTSWALSLLLNRCLSRLEATFPYRSETTSQSERKGLRRTSPPTLKRLAMWTASPVPIDLPIIIIFLNSKPTWLFKNSITYIASFSICSEEAEP